MSISNNYAPDSNQGNGVTTIFTGTWKVLSASYFRCYIEEIATGTLTLLTQGSQYTLTFDDSGYQITTAVAYSSAYNIIRAREVDLNQSNPYRTSKGYQGGVLETSLDKLTAIDQDQQNAINRSLKKTIAGVNYDLAGAKITNMGAPTNADDGVTKAYADALAITAGNVPLPTLGQVGYFLRAISTGVFAWFAAGALALKNTIATADIDAAAVTPPKIGGLPLGQCRLYLNGGNLTLAPYNGNQLFINGAFYTIPSATVTLSASGLTPDTLYYIYAYMSGATMTLEASATGHSTDATYGNEIKTGDATRVLVGMARPVTGPAWVDSATQRFVISWFNRRDIIAQRTLSADRTTTSTTQVEITPSDRVEFITFADEPVNANSSGLIYTSASNGSVSITFDGTTNEPGVNQANTTPTAPAQSVPKLLSEGYHYATLSGKMTAAGTLIVNGTGVWLSTNIVRVRG